MWSYDDKNRCAHLFWENSDLSERRVGQEIFGKKGLGYESDQVSLDDAVSFVLGCGNATFEQDSL